VWGATRDRYTKVWPQIVPLEIRVDVFDEKRSQLWSLQVRAAGSSASTRSPNLTPYVL
jgi:hypothetical protein